MSKIPYDLLIDIEILGIPDPLTSLDKRWAEFTETEQKVRLLKLRELYLDRSAKITQMVLEMEKENG